jgi:hypothetical protein
MSWSALVPILGPVQRVGSQLAAAATGTTAAVVVGVAGLLPGATSAHARPVLPVSERAATQAPEAPAADHLAAGDARSGGIGGDGPGRGTGAHADVPGPGSGSDRSEEPTGNGGSGGAGGLPGGEIEVDDTVGGLNDVVKDNTDTVDDVVDGATDAVTGAVDGATDVVDDLLGGAGVSDLVDEPVEDLTDLLGGLLGS